MNKIDATGSMSGRVLFASLFIFPLPRHDASWAEHYVADERKEGPRGRSICLNHLSERSRSSSRHDLGSRSPSSLSFSITIDRGREEGWQKIRESARLNHPLARSRSYRPRRGNIERRIFSLQVSTRDSQDFETKRRK